MLPTPRQAIHLWRFAPSTGENCTYHKWGNLEQRHESVFAQFITPLCTSPYLAGFWGHVLNWEFACEGRCRWPAPTSRSLLTRPLPCSGDLAQPLAVPATERD